jgi:glycosyltransferase involved in cell wall biosynthesis
VEGFIGITVLEALALRTPVIAFDTRDVRLALTDGETGVIVPNGDTRTLAMAILRLLSDPAEGARLAEAGCTLVHEKFAFSRLAERLEEIYLGILASPRTGRGARQSRGNGTA